MVDVARVNMFGLPVGTFRWDERYGVAAFEYDASFLGRGLEPSPLPLAAAHEHGLHLENPPAGRFVVVPALCGNPPSPSARPDAQGVRLDAARDGQADWCGTAAQLSPTVRPRNAPHHTALRHRTARRRRAAAMDVFPQHINNLKGIAATSYALTNEAKCSACALSMAFCPSVRANLPLLQAFMQPARIYWLMDLFFTFVSVGPAPGGCGRCRGNRGTGRWRPAGR